MSNGRLCAVCQHQYDEQDSLATTRCRHIFHKQCILDWLTSATSCPVCRCAVTRTSLMEYYLPTNQVPTSQYTGTIPKNIDHLILSRNARRKKTDSNRNLSFPPTSELNLPTNSIVLNANSNPNIHPPISEGLQSLLENIDNQNIHNENVSTRPSSLNNIAANGASALPVNSNGTSSFQNLNNTVLTNVALNSNLNRPLPANINPPNQLEIQMHAQQSQLNRLTAMISQMSEQFSQLNTQNHEQHDFSQINNNRVENPELLFPNPNTRLSHDSNLPQHNATQNRNVSNIMITHSSKVANIINSWHISFTGQTSQMPVGKFIYIINSLVNDNLAGDFNLLSEHCHLLFVGRAKDWYWRYRRNVHQIVWHDLCVALQYDFSDHLMDDEVKDLIRARKQGFNEPFEEYYSDVLRICDRLRTIIPDSDMVGMLKRGLRPHIQKEIFYLHIRTVSELRHLMMRRENLSRELEQKPHLDRNVPIRRQVHELENPVITDEPPEEISEVNKETSNLHPCYNCREIGHHYKDCLEPKTVFCYGCGTPNVYKPQCPKCLSGNSKPSGSNNTSFRSKTA